MSAPGSWSEANGRARGSRTDLWHRDRRSVRTLSGVLEPTARSATSSTRPTSTSTASIRGVGAGLEEGVVAVMAAMDPTKEERDDGADGVSAVWAHEFCQELGLGGIHVIERVAAATR